jgi:putative phage-type endonuclease
MENSDSDYQCSAVSDTESESSIESIYEIDVLTEEDWLNLYEMIDELVVELLTENVLKISNANIYKDISTEIMNILYETIGHLFLEDEDLICEIQYLVDQIIDMEMEQLNIPKRSLTMTIDTLKELDVINKINIEEKLNILRNIPQPAQKTTEWYEFRYNLLSASNAWKGLGSEAQMNSLIYEKCKPLDLVSIEQSNTFFTGSMHWGVKYEPVTIMLYEEMYHTKIEEFGCVEHPKYNFIGASPDGINVDSTNARYGRMLEIKNIVNREITGIPKTEYWIQTQLQMETCDLDTCDFVETRFKEYVTEEEFYMDTKPEYKGVILHFIERPNMEVNDINEMYKPSVPIYIYKPLNIENTKESIEEWIDIEKAKMNNGNHALFNTIYWYMDEFSCVLIQRNRQWFDKAIIKLKSVWDTILKERVTGYEHRSAKKRKSKVNINMNDVSNSYVTNISQKNTLCLIKMDENGNIL